MGESRPGRASGDNLAPYRTAFLDWLACALAGQGERAAVAAAAVGGSIIDRVAAIATAGHVLDFDDTYGPGLSHISAPTAPAALLVGASIGATIGEVIEAYAEGFESMAVVAKASHPRLYLRGWHPTAVTGTIGAATAAARLLGLDDEQTDTARKLSLLGAGGLLAAFGTDGKSLQVGVASGQGVRAALLANAGVPAVGDVAAGFASAYGGVWSEPGGPRAIDDNWIKAFPCCLQTHSAIEAAERAGLHGADLEGSGVVTVHSRSRQAAPYDDVSTGLEAKFSIPYTVAYTLLNGAPDVRSFDAVEVEVLRVAARITVVTDDDLEQSEAILEWGGDSPVRIRVEAARGSPSHPLSQDQLDRKIRSLAGSRLDGALDDPSRPASAVLALLETA